MPTPIIDPDSTKAASEFEKSLTGSIDRLKEAKEEGRTLSEHLKIGLSAVEEKVNNINNGLDKLGESVGVTTDTLQKALNPWKLLTSEIQNVVKRLDRAVDLTLDFGKASQNSIKIASDQAVKLGMSFEDVTKAQDVLLTNASLTQTQFKGFTEKSTDLAKALNIDTQSTSELGAAMVAFNKESNPSDLGNIAASFNKMQNNVGLSSDQMNILFTSTKEAVNQFTAFGKGTNKTILQNYAKGLSEVTGMYKKMGLTVDDATKKVNDLLNPDKFEDNAFAIAQMGISYGDYVKMLEGGDAEQVMGKMSSGMRDIAKQAQNMNYFQKKAYADSLGMTVQELNRLGKMSDQEFAATQQNAEDSGQTVEQKMIERMDKFSSNVTRVTEQLTNMITPLVDQLEPFLKNLNTIFMQISEFMQKNILPFFEKIGGLISGQKGFFSWLTIGIMAFIPIFIGFIGFLFKLFDKAQSLTKWFKELHGTSAKVPEKMEQVTSKMSAGDILRATGIILAVIGALTVIGLAILGLSKVIPFGEMVKATAQYALIIGAMTVIIGLSVLVALALTAIGKLASASTNMALGALVTIGIIAIIGLISFALGKMDKIMGTMQKGASEFLKVIGPITIIIALSALIALILVGLGALTVAIALMGLGLGVFIAVTALVMKMAFEIDKLLKDDKKVESIIKSVEKFKKISAALFPISDSMVKIAKNIREMKKNIGGSDREIEEGTKAFNKVVDLMFGKGVDGVSMLTSLELLNKLEVNPNKVIMLSDAMESISKAMVNLSEILASESGFSGAMKGLTNKINQFFGRNEAAEQKKKITSLLEYMKDIMNAFVDMPEVKGDISNKLKGIEGIKGLESTANLIIALEKIDEEKMAKGFSKLSQLIGVAKTSQKENGRGDVLVGSGLAGFFEYFSGSKVDTNFTSAMANMKKLGEIGSAFTGLPDFSTFTVKDFSVDNSFWQKVFGGNKGLMNFLLTQDLAKAQQNANIFDEIIKKSSEWPRLYIDKQSAEIKNGNILLKLDDEFRNNMYKDENMSMRAYLRKIAESSEKTKADISVFTQKINTAIGDGTIKTMVVAKGG
jgi:hypothetical protein